MTLIEQLKTTVLDALAPHGWRELFARHGLDISVPADRLEEELSRPLKVDRGVPGFEEFSLAGVRGVEPGQLGLSLLYHALASPCCVAPTLLVYPTLAQLDAVENYIYSRNRITLAGLQDPVLAIFAYQYRDRRRTTHRQHADVAFSRTGVARVGTHPAEYDGASRGYSVNPGSGIKGFRVLPARYGLFIAERRVRGRDGAVLRPSKLDGELIFLFPVHKIFSGDECLFRRDENGNLVPVHLGAVNYTEVHVNEKLSRVHDEQGGENDGFVPPHPTIPFNLKAYPFVRDSRTDTTLVRLSPVGASCQIMPASGKVVATATQFVDGKEELVRFKVPEKRTTRERPNRYWSTFEIEARGFSRAAPEYLNIRHEPQPDKLADLNQLDSATFNSKVLENGGYEAVHFIDNSCDGVLTVKPVSGISLPIHCAFSLVTATDYFPQVDQVEVEEWIERHQGVPTGLANIDLTFPQGGPQPMSDGRFTSYDEGIQDISLSYQLPNCNLPHPLTPGRSAFELDDPSSFTVTAIVGLPGVALSLETIPAPRRTLSWLPDAAADVYAPGWDVSQHQRDGRNMMASYGLGSPFPEDAKLCAALNSFWPAVAPDSSRTYGFGPPRPNKPRRQLFTSIPLTDRELGYHPQHPRVLAKEVASEVGWDGDHGPYLSPDTGTRHVYASNPLRADLTKTALDGKVHFAGLDEITTVAYISRIHALSWCRENIDEWFRLKFGTVFNHRQSGWWLVSFEVVPKWEDWRSTVLPRLSKDLIGAGYIFVFATVGDREEFESPPLRVRYPLLNRLEIRLSGLDGFHPDSTKEPAPVVVLRKNNDQEEKLMI
ncbi:hypothetical protein [Trichocoleus sp. FACHB-262]|uniref:hypothetical protein n=1 Tax=Trichocoleus sp. FACHB-262 TaxID=2692869 RepID=UPI001685ED4C|nr:hypothetical protein [Trichocoleus sp. FACHB-262]MBD2120284.1 hypothetical protein [Trichocoleus sp. FACHB-262]